VVLIVKVVYHPRFKEVYSVDPASKPGRMEAIGSIQELDKVLPPYWCRGNPVDLVGVLDRATHIKCFEILARCENIDGMIVLGTIIGSSFFGSIIAGITDASAEKEERIKEEIKKIDKTFANKINELMARFKKPIIPVTMMPEGSAKTLGILTFPTPERAVKVLAKLFEYSKHSDR
jgi:acyl-CoA synthetase (NDP forming)